MTGRDSRRGLGIGNWVLVIQGAGAYANGAEDDADRLAGEFLAELRGRGQAVDAASFLPVLGRPIQPGTSGAAPPRSAPSRAPRDDRPGS